MQQELKPTLTVMAGPNGSGKTTITNQLLLHQWTGNSFYINPDNIAQEKFGDWNSHKAILKAAQLAMELRETCLQESQNFIFQTVLSAADKIDFLHRAKQANYFIRLFFIGTASPEINKKRIAQRVKEKGHHVPDEKVVSRYYKSIENCKKIVSLADRLYVYDNSIDYQTPTLLFRSTAGKLEKQYKPNIDNWALPIFEALEK